MTILQLTMLEVQQNVLTWTYLQNALDNNDSKVYCYLLILPQKCNVQVIGFEISSKGLCEVQYTCLVHNIVVTQRTN